MAKEPTPTRRTLRRVLWFVAIYAISVAIIGTVAWFIRLWIA